MSELGIFYPNVPQGKLIDSFTGTLNHLCSWQKYDEMVDKINKGEWFVRIDVSLTADEYDTLVAPIIGAHNAGGFWSFYLCFDIAFVGVISGTFEWKRIDTTDEIELFTNNTNLFLVTWTSSQEKDYSVSNAMNMLDTTSPVTVYIYENGGDSNE